MMAQISQSTAELSEMSPKSAEATQGKQFDDLARIEAQLLQVQERAATEGVGKSKQDFAADAALVAQERRGSGSMAGPGLVAVSAAPAAGQPGVVGAGRKRASLLGALGGADTHRLSSLLQCCITGVERRIVELLGVQGG